MNRTGSVPRGRVHGLTHPTGVAALGGRDDRPDGHGAHAGHRSVKAIMFDITRMALTVQKLCSFVEDSFRDIKRSLDQPGLTVGGQGSPSPPLWELYVHTTQENSLMHGPERSVVFERSCLLFLGLRALTTLEPEECVIYIRPCIYIYTLRIHDRK